MIWPAVIKQACFVITSSIRLSFPFGVQGWTSYSIICNLGEAVYAEMTYYFFVRFILSFCHYDVLCQLEHDDVIYEVKFGGNLYAGSTYDILSQLVPCFQKLRWF